jgi:Peptidase family M23
VHAVGSPLPPGETPSPSPSPPELSSDPSPSTSPTPSPSPSPEPSPSPDPSPPLTPPPPTGSPTPPASPPTHGVRVVPWFGPIPSHRAAPIEGTPGPYEGQPLEGGSPHHGRTPDLTTEQLFGGTYSSERLVVAAALLRAAGWSEERIRRGVYAPFIVVGPASWGDSWHATRYGPGSIVRRHEGQDVLCRYGAEVLAPEDGTIEFDTSLLGGRSARLVRPDGGYYYFAHFVDWNDRRFADGDEVRRGDVIGYCGDTGNATVAHVHLGWYGPDGEAIDPMRRLISWLEEAERNLPGSVSEAAADAAEALGSGSVPETVWALLHDPQPEGTLTAWRSVASGRSEPLDLTPVLMLLVVFGVATRRSDASRRGRTPLPGGIALTGAMWADRRGPPLS